MEKGNTVSISVSLENYICCEEQKDYVTFYYYDSTSY